MYCSKCGKLLEPELLVCDNCGQQVPEMKSEADDVFAKLRKWVPYTAGAIIIIVLGVFGYFQFRPKPVILDPKICSVATSALPPASAEERAAVAGIPPVSDTDLSRGPATAPVTIIEYSDYQ